MKRFFGWFLIICGILSLPGLLPKLSRVHSGYEVIGILLGQGLIFLLAYYCLRKPSSRMELQENSVVDQDKVDNSQERNKNRIYQYSFNTKDKNPSADDEVISPTVKLSYAPIFYDSFTWDSVDQLIFDYQKAELLDKCNPANYLVPYDHDKLVIANEVTIQVSKANTMHELKEVRKLLPALDVAISPKQIFDYLTVICNPANFTGQVETFKTANDLYQQILNSKNDLLSLEYLQIIVKEKIPDAKKQNEIKLQEEDDYRKFLVWGSFMFIILPLLLLQLFLN